MIDFNNTDQEQLKSKNLSKETVLSQIEIFKKGISPTNLVAAATLGNGLLSFSAESQEALKKYYSDNCERLLVQRFVPASGAASRMFKFLFNFLDSYNFGEETLESYLERTQDKEIKFFNDNLSSFPFYQDAIEELKKLIPGYEDLKPGDKLFKFIAFILGNEGFNFGNLPKGVLPFHYYNEENIATAFEEHLLEAASCVDGSKVRIHFTISEKHRHLFKDLSENILENVIAQTGKTFDLEYSFQKSSTDTIAVTEGNQPFRNNDGSILFRPSGHGALIENLNELDADLVFVKNIDNVVTRSSRDLVVNYKKVLAGLLLKTQENVFSFLKELDNGLADFSDVTEFMTKELNVKFPDEFDNYKSDEKQLYIKTRLNKPIRVCGMVKNEGQPGGGPFWTLNSNGETSLQIVESAQMDLSKKDQEVIVNQATHFNPVDLVCGLKDYKGDAFNLSEFVDSETAFISSKTQSGKALRALELPGLWNGSMAGWNTLFVEVPLATFNPVKTVNDLIKPGHQCQVLQSQ